MLTVESESNVHHQHIRIGSCCRRTLATQDPRQIFVVTGQSVAAERTGCGAGPALVAAAAPTAGSGGILIDIIGDAVAAADHLPDAINGILPVADAHAVNAPFGTGDADALCNVRQAADQRRTAEINVGRINGDAIVRDGQRQLRRKRGAAVLLVHAENVANPQRTADIPGD